MRKRGTVVACASAILYLALTVAVGVGQNPCPSVGQLDGLNGQPNAGLLNGANVTIEVVGNALQAVDSTILAAANFWTKIPGATFSFTIQNVDSVPTGNASASNPVVIFQFGPASDFAPGEVCAGAFMCTNESSLDANGNVVIASIEMNPNNTTSNTFLEEGFTHELGHGVFGLADCNGCTQSQSIMYTPETNPTDLGPTPCDQTYVFRNSKGKYGKAPSSNGGPPPLPPTCTPGNQPNRGTGGAPPCNTSPIIIDTESEGFHLTSANEGVLFDIAGNGHAIQMGWTDVHFHNAFLALPASDGLVHDGRELFGNFTPQPQSANPNGFIALAQYDLPQNGGNGNGMIDEGDNVFAQLRLWIDENHDGVCQPGELHRLSEFGVHSIALNYVASQRTDQFGNQFRYKAIVNPGERKDPLDETPSGDPGRWLYDVFFVAK